MAKIVQFLKGKKSYIVAAVTFVIGGLQAVGYPIPEWVFPLLGAAGLSTLRSGMIKL